MAARDRTRTPVNPRDIPPIRARKTEVGIARTEGLCLSQNFPNNKNSTRRALHAQQDHGPHRRRDRDAGGYRFKQQPRVDYAGPIMPEPVAGIRQQSGADKPRAVR
jgi:hypothetical protein